MSLGLNQGFNHTYSATSLNSLLVVIWVVFSEPIVTEILIPSTSVLFSSNILGVHTCSKIVGGHLTSFFLQQLWGLRQVTTSMSLSLHICTMGKNNDRAYLPGCSEDQMKSYVYRVQVSS